MKFFILISYVRLLNAIYLFTVSVHEPKEDCQRASALRTRMHTQHQWQTCYCYHGITV